QSAPRGRSKPPWGELTRRTLVRREHTADRAGDDRICGVVGDAEYGAERACCRYRGRRRRAEELREHQHDSRRARASALEDGQSAEHECEDGKGRCGGLHGCAPCKVTDSGGDTPVKMHCTSHYVRLNVQMY